MKYPVLESVRSKAGDLLSYRIVGDPGFYDFEVFVAEDPQFPEPSIELIDEVGSEFSLSLSQAKVLAPVLERIIKETIHHV